MKLSSTEPALYTVLIVIVQTPSAVLHERSASTESTALLLLSKNCAAVTRWSAVRRVSLMLVEPAAENVSFFVNDSAFFSFSRPFR